MSVSVQRKRLKNEGIFSNASMTPRLIRRFCRIDGESERMLGQAMARPGLSDRAYDWILQVSRTIADRLGSKQVGARHVA